MDNACLEPSPPSYRTTSIKLRGAAKLCSWAFDERPTMDGNHASRSTRVADTMSDCVVHYQLQQLFPKQRILGRGVCVCVYVCGLRHVSGRMLRDLNQTNQNTLPNSGGVRPACIISKQASYRIPSLFRESLRTNIHLLNPGHHRREMINCHRRCYAKPSRALQYQMSRDPHIGQIVKKLHCMHAEKHEISFI